MKPFQIRGVSQIPTSAQGGSNVLYNKSKQHLLEGNFWDDDDLDYLDEDFRQFLERNRSIFKKMHQTTHTSALTNITPVARFNSSNNRQGTATRSNSQNKILPQVPAKLIQIAERNRVISSKIPPSISSQSSQNIIQNILSSANHISSNNSSSVLSNQAATTQVSGQKSTRLQVNAINKMTSPAVNKSRDQGESNGTRNIHNSRASILKRRAARQCLPAIPSASEPEKPTQIVDSEVINRIKGYKDETKPEVSCKAWGIYKEEDAQIITGESTFEIREMASITKIMTCLVALKLFKRFELNLSSTLMCVSESATQVAGTSACLEQNQWYSAEDLLYGLMLPSGNDASLCLAENLGCLLYYEITGNKQALQSIEKIDTRNDDQQWEYVRLFIREMNKVSQQLNLKCSQFANPHGLNNKNNRSNCNDLAKLTMKALKWKLFRKIVSVKQYSGDYTIEDENGIEISGTNIWKNTNKLLESGYLGVKTGITTTAGACLSSFYSQYVEKLQRKVSVIIIVLGSLSTEERFGDTEKILDWYLKQLEEEQEED